MSKLFGDFIGGRAAFGLLLLRVVMGLGLMVHGYSKIGAPFSWMKAGSTPGWMQAFAAFAEFGGGFLLIVGLLTPLAAFAVAATMIGAILIGHSGDPWIKPGGRSWELASMYLVISAALGFTGPGIFSLDAFMAARSNRVSDERFLRVVDSNDAKLNAS